MSAWLEERLDKFLAKTKYDREPAVRIGVVAGVATSTVFGILFSVFDLTRGQLLTSLIILCLLTPIITAFEIRKNVWATPTVRRYVWHKVNTPKAEPSKARPLTRLTPAQLKEEKF